MKPVLQAILLADHVYEDKTGKKIICGTFNRVWLNRKGKPVQDHPTDSARKIVHGGTDPGCPWAYISLTDVVREIDVTLRFMNVSTNSVLLETVIKIKCNDPLETIEIALPLPRLMAIVNEPGTFSLELLWDGEIVGSHRVVAQDVPD